ncbi:zinc finger protein 638-like isoform X2 [Betta splendens]|uniref:Zinc finger protein 638-like isoform X2 n=1 Tax=Betta splendens TaxID=158456 RepID=A0A9W2Y1X1_BETSP|nr:zinc finger protein 638-like isoform X2 [Betta splendens]
MYHHQSQQQGPQPFSNGSRPPHQPPANQHQSRTPSDMLSQVIGFQFPRPTQLPDELESALAIRGARDMDHRLIDHRNQQNQHHNLDSSSGISQPGSYGANPVTVSSDNKPTHQQGADWSSYQPPNKLFVSPAASASQQSQQQPQSSHTGLNLPNWTSPANSSPLSQSCHSSGARGGGEGQGLYTPESAGSILASFGLSNEDLEVLSHYPDDQLTPDTLPFILRDIQINKSGNLKAVASTSASFSPGIRDIRLPTSHCLPLTHLQSVEVPSLLTVTQTAGKVIDYGHASRANNESSTRETFKREPLSSERTIKIYPSSLSSSTAKVDKAERQQVHLEHTEPSKHGDKDYRRTSSDHCKSRRSPGRDFPPSSKARNLDQDYRQERLKPRPLSEIRSEDSSRQSLSSSSDSKPVNKSKRFPSPTMVTDFSAMLPKVYPHTCTLCHTQSDEEKDWVAHVNTVGHTAACRDLRNRYPTWKPNLPSRSGRYVSRTLWDPRDGSPSQSVSRSRSPSPSSSKHRGDSLRPHGRSYSPHSYARPHYPEYHYSGTRSPPDLHQTSSLYRDHHPEKRNREPTGNSSRRAVKRPHDAAVRCPTKTNKQQSLPKQGPAQPSTKVVKSTTKPGPKSTKCPPARKKKRTVSPPAQDWSVADRLVYLTGIPNDALEQEVTDLVGAFGKINNVLLMPGSGEESLESEGQKASVCMVKAKDAEALATSTSLSIRGQQITASVAKKPEGGHCSDGNNSNLLQRQKSGPGEDSGGEADQKTVDEKGMVLITGLPESGWSVSDIISIVESSGTPSDIVMAAQIGKVLVSVPDIETAQELVKVNTFKPAKVKDQEVTMIQVKQRIGFSTPVALYNTLMRSVDTEESPAPVIWSSLLVINNVPDSLSASSEVQKLVRRFGTVIKTLVLNNMVICEMATATMALSVYKRFQTFPCIIQNNPLFFSRKPDAKAQTKVIAAYAKSYVGTSISSKGSQTGAVLDKEEAAHEEKHNSQLEEMGEDDNNDKREGTVKNRDMTTSSKNEGKDIELTKGVCNCANSDAILGGSVDVDIKDMATVQNAVETSEENKDISASEVTHVTVAGEETEPRASNGDAASGETVAPEIHKVTQEMVNVLLMECRTRFGSQPSSIAVSCREENEREIQGEKELHEKATEESKEQAKKHPEEEKKPDKEKKAKQARKEKVRERERREKERRPSEKEERAKRERDERMREWERRDRERWERKRAYGEGLPGSKSSVESPRKSSWRDDHNNRPEAEIQMDEEEEFPFNMSDFVTVDEVGDVTDIPSPVHLETIEKGGEALTSEPETVEDTPTKTLLEAPAETDKQVSERETHVAPESKTTCQTAALGSHTEHLFLNALTILGQPPEAAAEDSDSTEKGAPAAGTGPPLQISDKEGNSVSNSLVEEEMVVSNKTGEKTQDDDTEEMASSAATGNQEQFKDQTDIGDKCERMSMSADDILPPFDPSSPVGMEVLVPKTGFFCKACNRFFSGNKEAEINHCKTFKHYENLKKYMKTPQT